jgi:hypothetical protein
MCFSSLTYQRLKDPKSLVIFDSIVATGRKFAVSVILALVHDDGDAVMRMRCGVERGTTLLEGNDCITVLFSNLSAVSQVR